MQYVSIRIKWCKEGTACAAPPRIQVESEFGEFQLTSMMVLTASEILSSLSSFVSDVVSLAVSDSSDPRTLFDPLDCSLLLLNAAIDRA